MYHLHIVVPWIFATFALSFGLGRVWTGNNPTDAPLATTMFALLWLQHCVFCTLTIAPLLMDRNIAPTVHFIDFVSIQFVANQLFFKHTDLNGCTSTAFLNVSWLLAGWPWWPLALSFYLWYCEYRIFKSTVISVLQAALECYIADLQINANG